MKRFGRLFFLGLSLTLGFSCSNSPEVVVPLPPSASSARWSTETIPERIATGLLQPFDLVERGEVLFVADRGRTGGDAAIWIVAKSGLYARPIATGLRFPPTAIDADSTHVYWSADNAIFRAAYELGSEPSSTPTDSISEKVSESPLDILDGEERDAAVTRQGADIAGFIVLNNDYVFWPGGFGRLYRARKQVAAAAEIITGIANPRDIVTPVVRNLSYSPQGASVEAVTRTPYLQTGGMLGWFGPSPEDANQFGLYDAYPNENRAPLGSPYSLQQSAGLEPGSIRINPITGDPEGGRPMIGTTFQLLAGSGVRRLANQQITNNAPMGTGSCPLAGRVCGYYMLDLITQAILYIDTAFTTRVTLWQSDRPFDDDFNPQALPRQAIADRARGGDPRLIPNVRLYVLSTRGVWAIRHYSDFTHISVVDQPQGETVLQTQHVFEIDDNDARFAAIETDDEYGYVTDSRRGLVLRFRHPEATSPLFFRRN